MRGVRSLYLILFLVSVLFISSCGESIPLQNSPYDYDCVVDSVYVSSTENGATCENRCGLGDSVYYEVHYSGNECDDLDGIHIVIRNDYEQPPHPEMTWNYMCGLSAYPFAGMVGPSAIFYDEDITGTEGTLTGLFEIEFRWFDDEIDWRCSGQDVGYNGGDVMVYAFKWKDGEEGHIHTIEQERIFEDFDVDYGFKLEVNPNSCTGSVRQAVIKPEVWGDLCNQESPDWPEEVIEDYTRYPCYVFEEGQQDGICCPTDRYCNYEGECYPDTRNDELLGEGTSDFIAVDLAQHLDWDFKNYGFCVGPWMIGGYEDGGKWMDCDADLSDAVGDLHGQEDIPAYQCDNVLTTVNNGDFYAAFGYGQQVDVEGDSLFYTADRNACYLENQIEAVPSGEPDVGEYTQVREVECCGDDPSEYLIVDGDIRICCNSDNDFVNAQGLCSEYSEAGSFCDDGTCNSDEDCETCPEDCGDCPVIPYCGDSTCDANEDCSSCPGDCGECEGEEEGEEEGGDGDEGSGGGGSGSDCGDGYAEGSEECDMDDLEGQTCVGLGYDLGILACTEDCEFDESGCLYEEVTPVDTEGNDNFFEEIITTYPKSKIWVLWVFIILAVAVAVISVVVARKKK
jgi:hypothetical protein